MSLNLIKLYQKQSSWYKGTTTGVPVGICFHATGCNNNTLKRYGQPNDDDANRAESAALRYYPRISQYEGDERRRQSRARKETDYNAPFVFDDCRLQL